MSASSEARKSGPKGILVSGSTMAQTLSRRTLKLSTGARRGKDGCTSKEKTAYGKEEGTSHIVMYRVMCVVLCDLHVWDEGKKGKTGLEISFLNL